MTASQRAQISIFGASSAVFTGLNGGRNVSVTAGVDLSFRRRFGLNPSLEFRGLAPVTNGAVDAQRNALIGVQLSRSLGRFQPYGDMLFGRGRIDYSPPIPDPQHVFVYRESTGNVIEYGGGVHLYITDGIALLIEAQQARYATPATISTHLFATSVSVGAAYRFDFNRGFRRSRQ